MFRLNERLRVSQGIMTPISKQQSIAPTIWLDDATRTSTSSPQGGGLAWTSLGGGGLGRRVRSNVPVVAATIDPTASATATLGEVRQRPPKALEREELLVLVWVVLRGRAGPTRRRFVERLRFRPP